MSALISYYTTRGEDSKLVCKQSIVKFFFFLFYFLIKVPVLLMLLKEINLDVHSKRPIVILIVIVIYIYRERERERDLKWYKVVSHNQHSEPHDTTSFSYFLLGQIFSI